MRILHLSDTHLTRDPGPAHEALRLLLADCARLDGLDAVVVTGDLADDGSGEAYAEIRARIGGFARDRGIPAILATGNHDERTAFTEHLGTGHLDGPALSFDGPERAAATLVGGYRIVTLDSLVPGKGYGRLGQAQLTWLRELLAAPAPAGTVLAFHHPPIARDVAVQRALGLRDPGELAAAIAGSDVHLILTGHFHLQLTGQLAGVPVWVTPGVVSRVDSTAPAGTERAVRGAAATVVDLGGPGAPLLHVVHARDPRAGEVVYELDEPALTAVIQRLGPP